MNLRMPVGIDDFKEVREKYYFVDKTPFIQKLLAEHSKVTLLTRPRRFGKTLTMSMLKYFFALEDEKDSEKLFAGLAVSTEEEAMRQRGKYPVIFITLRDIKSLRWQDAYADLKGLIEDTYARFAYLQESDKLTKREKELIAVLLAGTAEETLYRRSLKYLTEFLYKHHQVRPILLIDEYDVPIQCGWENGYYDEVMMFMKVWLSGGLKTNAYLEFAVLTGVLRVVKESIFSDLNNLEICSVMTEKYSDVFGFTKQEVKRIAADFGNTDKMDELQAWYDGYSFGGKEIYNPWSVIQYFSAGCKPQPYWLNTSGNGIVRALLESTSEERMESLRAVLSGKYIESVIDEGVIYADIGQKENALYTMLLMTGYLTLAKKEQPDALTTFYYLRVPNLEIMQVYRSEILERMAQSVTTKQQNELFRALLSGRQEVFEQHLQEMLLQMVSYYDTQNKESFYHGFLLGLTALLAASYQVESNRESGCGRFDLALFPKRGDQAGVIMEFKVANEPEKLEETARAALRQIQEKVYITEFQKRSIVNVYQYGIAFCGKMVRIVQGESGL